MVSKGIEARTRRSTRNARTTINAWVRSFKTISRRKLAGEKSRARIAFLRMRERGKSTRATCRHRSTHAGRRCRRTTTTGRKISTPFVKAFVLDTLTILTRGGLDDRARERLGGRGWNPVLTTALVRHIDDEIVQRKMYDVYEDFSKTKG